MKTFYSLLVITLLGSSPFAFSQTTSHLFRPATDKANGEVVRNEDDTAWGGEYASNSKPYNPIFIGEIATVTGDPIIVWARLRGFAVQTKGIAESGNQTELSWNWEKPKDWKWVKLGSYTRAQLGKSLLIIRGPDADANAGINVVLFTTDPNLNPDGLTEKDLAAKVKADATPANTAPKL
ncbi:MAG: hypothetical protein WCH43_02955 [Verrucomicrobiota bacterium]